MDAKKIGDNIRFFRKGKRLTQQKLAEISGIDRSTISELENGNRPYFHVSTIKGLARALNIKWEDLFRENTEPDPPAVHEPAPEYTGITDGLRELLEDEKTMRMMFINEAEVQWLKSICFRANQKPTKQDYIDMLFIYRSSSEEE